MKSSWWMRVGVLLLGVVIVDTWLSTSQCMDGIMDLDTQAQFYTYLAEEMIDNTIDTRARRGRDQQDKGSSPLGVANAVAGPPRNEDGSPRSGVGIHLTPTKRKRKDKNGQQRNQVLQGNCRVPGCKYKTSHHCSACTSKAAGKEYWICHSKTGRECFHRHVMACHMGGSNTIDDNDD